MVTLTFLPHEWKLFKRHKTKGGWQDLETWLYDHVDRDSGVCEMPEEIFDRVRRYCTGRFGGSGGPNRRVRDACIPCLRRCLGIDLTWS